MAKKREPIARRHRREAGVPASSGAHEAHRVHPLVVEAGTWSVPVVQPHHQGLEAVETRWAAVHPVAGGETYPVRVELLDQELEGAENALEQEAAERRNCIA
jgi:hypothetical protein